MLPAQLTVTHVMPMAAKPVLLEAISGQKITLAKNVVMPVLNATLKRAA